MLSHRVRQPLDDATYIHVDLSFETAERAAAFRTFLEENVWASRTASPALAGAPETRILIDVEECLERHATSCTASAPASWQSRQRASYESSAPTTIVSPEYGAGIAVDEPLRRRRRAAAAVADGLQLVDELCAREKLGHGPERLPAEVLVEPGRDHADAALGERERGIDNGRLEELRLVDPHDVAAAGACDQLRAAVDGHGGHAHAGMTHDVGRVVAVVDPWLEQEDTLTRDLRRRRRRIISSLLPLNIGPHTTSSQPPRCGGTLITGGIARGRPGLDDRHVDTVHSCPRSVFRGFAAKTLLHFGSARRRSSVG